MYIFSRRYNESNGQPMEAMKQKELRDWVEIGGVSRTGLQRQRMLKLLGMCSNSSILSQRVGIKS
jgi:hypothetical protein